MAISPRKLATHVIYMEGMSNHSEGLKYYTPVSSKPLIPLPYDISGFWMYLGALDIQEILFSSKFNTYGTLCLCPLLRAVLYEDIFGLPCDDVI